MKIKSFNKQKLYIAFFITGLICVFYAGYRISNHSSEKITISLNPISSKRGLAGAEKPSLAVLNADQQRNLINNALIKQASNTTTFYLGHFMVKSQGNYVLACRKYQTLNMTFFAPGISSHGHVPEMQIQSICKEAEGNPLRIGPFIIPKKQINETSIRDQNLFNSKESVILFRDISLRRPKRWILNQIQLKNERENESITINLSVNSEKSSLIINL